jgi:hypothetical protein
MPSQRFHRRFLFLALIIASVLPVSCGGQQANALMMAAMKDMPDFVQGARPEAAQAYRFAAANQHEMTKYPCYCGCVSLGHKSNLDCYIQAVKVDSTIVFDNHAAGCGICVEITQDVMRLLREGWPSTRIRAYIDQQYSKRGPGTMTLYPTD